MRQISRSSAASRGTRSPVPLARVTQYPAVTVRTVSGRPSTCTGSLPVRRRAKRLTTSTTTRSTIDGRTCVSDRISTTCGTGATPSRRIAQRAIRTTQRTHISTNAADAVGSARRIACEMCSHGRRRTSASIAELESGPTTSERKRLGFDRCGNMPRPTKRSAGRTSGSGAPNGRRAPERRRLDTAASSGSASVRAS